MHRSLPLTMIFLASFGLVSHSQQMEDVRIQVLPLNHALNTPIDNLPVHPNSANYVAGIGNNTSLHPDFGTQWDDNGTIRQIGIPYNVVDVNQPLVPITFYSYPEESDPGPWPIPQDPYIETVFDWRNTEAGDRHMLIVDTATHMLYETGGVYGNADGTEWEGGSGAVFSLNSNNLRPETWTSADAAGLPIFPLLIRYDEAERAMQTGGEIPHAIRFTAVHTQHAYIWPARHYASSSTNSDYPPMGLRFRLKADYDISGYTPRMQVILRTMKKYGLIVADNGSNWFFQGTHDDRWDDTEINSLKNLHGSDFEAVDISPWLNSPEFDPNSAAVPSSGVNAVTTNDSKGYLLYQNYPNPVHSTAAIIYTIPYHSAVRLEVTDILGKQVAVPVNKTQQSGSYRVLFDVSGLPKGVYFYSLKLSGTEITRKMIVY